MPRHRIHVATRRRKALRRRLGEDAGGKFSEIRRRPSQSHREELNFRGRRSSLQLEVCDRHDAHELRIAGDQHRREPRQLGSEDPRGEEPQDALAHARLAREGDCVRGVVGFDDEERVLERELPEEPAGLFAQESPECEKCRR